MAIPTLLLVEDNQFGAIIAKEMILANRLDVAVVSDAENAWKALMGQPFLAWDPQRDVYFERDAVAIWGAIWDNQFPAKRGEKAADDMGIRTAEAIVSSKKVSAAVCSRFAVSSADPAAHFQNCRAFKRILSKPIPAEQLRDLIQAWRKT